GDVGERSDPTRRGHRNTDGLGNGARGRDVYALLRAVAADVRIYDAAGAEVFNLARQADRARAAGLGPSLYGDVAVAGIDANRNTAGEAAARFAHDFRVG